MKELAGAFNQEKVLDCENRWIVWSSSITGLVLVTVLSCSCVSGRTPLRLVRFMTGRYWAATASLCRLRWPLLQPGRQRELQTHDTQLWPYLHILLDRNSLKVPSVSVVSQEESRVKRVVWSSPKCPWLHPAREDKLSGDDQVAKQRNDVERLHQLQWVGNSWKYEVVSIYSASPIIPHFKLMHKN